MRASAYIKGKIKDFEGLRLSGYPDGTGCSVGYGHYLPGADPYNCGEIQITSSEAEDLFKENVDRAENGVKAYVTVRLNQNQFDALVDFVYNLGHSKFAGSTLLKKVNAQAPTEEVQVEFRKWVYATIGGVKQKLSALEKRREFEANLYGKPAMLQAGFRNIAIAGVGGLIIAGFVYNYVKKKAA